MCRILTYLGPNRSADALLLEPEHSLVVQSYAPKEMDEALLNADGFGVAWYTEEKPEPALYRSTQPMWSDDNLTRMAPHLVSSCFVANIRSATPGLGVHLANTQPFVRGNLAFSHNGLLGTFRQAVMRPLRRTLTDASQAAIEGNTDSEHIFAAICDVEGMTLVDRVRRGIRAVATIVEGLGERALLNVSVSDGTAIVSARYAVRAEPGSLYVAEETPLGPGSMVCSEPVFSEGVFRPVDAGQMVIQTQQGVVQEAL